MPHRPDSTRSAPRSEPLIARTFDETPLWAGLFENLRETFFAPALPPLELTSAPIPVQDRMAVKTNPWAVGTSTILNMGLLALVILFGLRAITHAHPSALQSLHTRIDDLNLIMPRMSQAASGGGGGGLNDPNDPSKGRLPRLDMKPIAPPQVPVLENPKIALDPAIAVPPDVKLPDNPSLPNIGVHSSVTVSLISSGPGRHNGIGTGDNNGLGPGHGPGYAPGQNGGVGDGIYQPGGDVSAPVLVVAPEADFSEEARRAKYQGVCIITVIVDAHGNPQNPRRASSVPSAWASTKKRSNP